MGELNAVALTQELRGVFEAGKTRSAEWRIEQLNALSRMVTENEKEIAAVGKEDIGRPVFESFTAEFVAILDSAKYAVKNVKKWMAPLKASTTLPTKKSTAAIIAEPLGVVLIIAPWNYPFLLSLDPMIGAIAAGNAMVLKPSEVAPASSALLARLIPSYLDSSAIRVVEGGVPETTSLLGQAWDKIFYTGSPRVGKIILAAAAKHLTPCALELGGKSPCIVDSTGDIGVVAKRIAWGKWTSNDGQACIAPDYVLAEESVVPKLISKLKEALKGFYGDDPSTCPDIGRVVNSMHFKRLCGLLNHESTVEKVVHGGQVNEKELYIAPTLVLDPPMDSPIMQEEIFGPLLVIVTVKDVNEAIKIVRAGPKPLAMYIFSTNSHVVEQILDETSAGGVTVNDCVMHFLQPDLPFGGVGNSGFGAYHGKHSFDEFSHKKGVLYRSLYGGGAVRYPPYTAKKQKLIRALMSGSILDLVLIFLGFK
ncbi:unnamed protein product [Calypogeia fissa]